jgi:hypothetical protein
VALLARLHLFDINLHSVSAKLKKAMTTKTVDALAGAAGVIGQN